MSSGRSRNGLGRRHPCDGHPEGGAAHVVQSRAVEEVDATRIATVLAADAHRQLGVGVPPALHSNPDQLADAGLVERLERAHVDDASVEVCPDEAALDVIAREADRRLRQVVGSEADEVGVSADQPRDQARPRELEHRADPIGHR